MFEWLFGKKEPVAAPVKEEVQRDEVLQMQDRIIVALEIALADANEKATINYERGRETIGALLLANGGEFTLSPDIIEMASTSDFEITTDQDEDGSVILAIVPVEESPDGDSETV